MDSDLTIQEAQQSLVEEMGKEYFWFIEQNSFKTRGVIRHCGCAKNLTHNTRNATEYNRRNKNGVDLLLVY